MASWKAVKGLLFSYGHLRTVQTERAVDADGQPVPWYTYPAIEYLKQFDYSEKTVFEFGSGNSTLFWAARAKQVVSIEDEEEWHQIVQKQLPGNCTLVWEPDLWKYADSITTFPDKFDIIVIDGPARELTRLRCAERAVERLRPGGLIILDNADWLPKSARFLRESGLLQVDMSGFLPIAGYSETTSLFFDRECRLRPLTDRQPMPSAAADPKNWEENFEEQRTGELYQWNGGAIKNVERVARITKPSPEGIRTFDLIFKQLSARRFGWFIFDVDRQRVLDGARPVEEASTAQDQIARVDAMTWDEFCELVRRSPVRRYLIGVEKRPRISERNEQDDGDGLGARPTARS